MKTAQRSELSLRFAIYSSSTFSLENASITPPMINNEQVRVKVIFTSPLLKPDVPNSQLKSTIK